MAPGRLRVLVLAQGLPFPAFGGGLLRTHRLVRALAERHDVTLVAFTYGGDHEPPDFPVRVVTVPWEPPPLYAQMRAADGELSRAAYEALARPETVPWFASCTESAALRAALARLQDGRFHVRLIEGSDMGLYLDDLPPAAATIVDFFDVHSLRTERRLPADAAAGPDADRVEAERALRFERGLARRCDVSLAVSAVEAEAARRLLEARRVEIVPNGVDTAFFAARPGAEWPGHLLFTGLMNYAPNVDAATYFAARVLPEIRRRAPHARLTIAGDNPAPAVAGLHGDAVIVTGRVADMRPHFDTAEVVVVPVRAGGGTRLKLLEAAASGKAIVSTSLGAEGLDFGDGEHLLIADSAEAFAAAVVWLLEDGGSRRRLGEAARARALRYDWGAIGRSFCGLIEELAAARC